MPPRHCLFSYNITPHSALFITNKTYSETFSTIRTSYSLNHVTVDILCANFVLRNKIAGGKC